MWTRKISKTCKCLNLTGLEGSVHPNPWTPLTLNWKWLWRIVKENFKRWLYKIIQIVDKLEKPLRFASWFPTLISCSPNLPRVYIRLCKHGNHFTFLHCKIKFNPKLSPVLLECVDFGCWKICHTWQLSQRTEREWKTYWTIC